ncbi:MAG TPA: hypothetical protein VEV41_12375, partial [Terriglobales bacterium]|nr:hypothetical protein [Terriglobales bacterium]
MKLCAVFLATAFILGARSSGDDTQKNAEELLQRARQLSDIRAPNAPGFRLILTFSFIGEGLDTL